MELIDKEYEEGDKCPNCKEGILVVNPPHNDDGICYLKCQDCNYDATDDIYREVKNEYKK